MRLEKKTVLLNIAVQLGDKLVHAMVQEECTAHENYEDALASGHGAVLAKREEQESGDILSLNLGNLLPGQKAIVKVELA